MTVLTSTAFRHSKHLVRNIEMVVNRTPIINKTDTAFTDELVMEPINLALFDVFDSSGRTLCRERTFRPDYWFEDGKLKTRLPGNYVLRVYEGVNHFETGVIPVAKQIWRPDTPPLHLGVPRWPQILEQPAFGYARVANNGRDIAFASNGGTGQVWFCYRMVNAFGQLSEPACIVATAI